MPDHQIVLAIAGLTIRILDDAPEIPLWLNSRCKPFHVDPASAPQPSVTIAIHRDPLLDAGCDQLVVKAVGEPGGFWMHGVDFIVARKRCGLPFEVEAFPDAGMAGILRWILGIALLEQGGLLLHAASCSIEGGGIAFPGPSGRGKTTLSRLLQPHFPVFTDETTALRFEGDIPLIYSTPFAGELGAIAGPVAAPLELLCFLRHASAMQAQPMRLIDAAGQLMGSLFMPLCHEPWLSATLALVERVVRTVPCFDFGFCPTEEAVEVLNGLTRSAAAAA